MTTLAADYDPRADIPSGAPAESNRAFRVTLSLALALHILLILGVHIEPPRPERRAASTVEVVVLHQPAPGAVIPDKVAAPAQTTQSGGGEGLRDATTRQAEAEGPQEPAPPPSNAPDLDLDIPAPDAAAMPPAAATPDEAANPVVDEEPPPATQPPAQDDTRTISFERPEPATSEVAPMPARAAPSPERIPQVAPLPVGAAEILASRNQELARLAARVEDRTSVFANRPRRTSISSSTKEYKYATYLEAWRRKVEQIGNINYPEEARRRHLYGNLILRVAVRADGSVEQIQVLRPSGFPVLDEAAVHIVELAAPFAPFPPDIAAETDVLDITRTWQFQRNNQLGWGN